MRGGETHSRRISGARRAGRVVLIVLLASLVALPLVPAGGAQGATLEGEWRFRSSAPLGDTFVVDLSLRPDAELPVLVGDALNLRFDLLYHANGSRVRPAPVLTVETAHCDPGPPVSGLLCDEERVALTRSRFTLDPSTERSSYAWTSDRERVFTATGTWVVRVGLEADPEAPPAVFQVHAAQPLAGFPIPFVRDIVAALFGAQVGPFGQILAFLVWVVFFILTGSILAKTMRRTVFAPYRVDPTVGRLAVRLLVSVWVILGIALAMWAVWRVNFWAGLAALGLLSVALGFGMQNTVANVMGGVNLALDKPFVIGDRVRIGETWGDVEEVGIRSTKILTVKKESVIIPNKLMDEREIWNFTLNQPETRRDIEVLISYDSDRRLAEALMLEAARETKDVLPYPRPRVFLREFADSGLQLQLRCWIPDARNLRPIGSELRKAIKDKFDENGVEIPYPYRTLVEKSALARPKRARPEEIEEHATPDIRMPKLLYATAGPEPLGRTANLVARIAHALDMQLIVLHIQPRGGKVQRAEAYRIQSAFEMAAGRHQVPLRVTITHGAVAEEIKRVLEEERADLLAMGSSGSPFRWAPRRVADLTKEVRQTAGIPVMIVPRDLKITQRALEHYRQIVEKRTFERQRREEQHPVSGDDETDDDEEERGEETKPDRAG